MKNQLLLGISLLATIQVGASPLHEQKPTILKQDFKDGLKKIISNFEKSQKEIEAGSIDP